MTAFTSNLERSLYGRLGATYSAVEHGSVRFLASSDGKTLIGVEDIPGGGGVISVSQGGTGVDASATGPGYARQATKGSAFTFLTSIPASDISDANMTLASSTISAAVLSGRNQVYVENQLLIRTTGPMKGTTITSTGTVPRALTTPDMDGTLLVSSQVNSAATDANITSDGSGVLTTEGLTVSGPVSFGDGATSFNIDGSASFSFGSLIIDAGGKLSTASDLEAYSIFADGYVSTKVGFSSASGIIWNDLRDYSGGAPSATGYIAVKINGVNYKLLAST